MCTVTLLLGLGKGLTGKNTNLTFVFVAPMLKLDKEKVKTLKLFGFVTVLYTL